MAIYSALKYIGRTAKCAFDWRAKAAPTYATTSQYRYWILIIIIVINRGALSPMTRLRIDSSEVWKPDVRAASKAWRMVFFLEFFFFFLQNRPGKSVRLRRGLSDRVLFFFFLSHIINIPSCGVTDNGASGCETQSLRGHNIGTDAGVPGVHYIILLY